MNNEKKTKLVFWWLINITLLVLIFVGISAGSVLRGQVASERTITVLGEGKVIVAPDIATLSFSVVTEGKDAETIQTQNIEKMNLAIDFVKSEGVDMKDIKTSEFNLSPKYRYERFTGISEIDGYTITQTVVVKIRNLEKVAPVLGGLTSRGINQIGALNFDIDDKDNALEDARSEAFEEAREKADRMAEANGVRVKKVVTFSENTGGYPMPYYERSVALDTVGSTASAPSIESGSQEIVVRVSVTYEIR